MGTPIYEVFRFAFPNADSSDLNGAVVRGETLEAAVQTMIDYIGINMEEATEKVRFFHDIADLKQAMKDTDGCPPFWFYHLRIEDKDDVILCAFNCC
jgi:hypothetical protein